MLEDKTLTDRIIRKLRNNPIFAVIIIAFGFIIALGTLTDSLQQQYEFWFGQKQTHQDKIKLEPLLKNLNVLIFNASRIPDAHFVLAKSLKNSVPSIEIEKSYSWKNRREMDKTRIYYIGSKNHVAAAFLADWMKGDQEIIDYYSQLKRPNVFPDKSIQSHTKISGIDPKRDLVIFIGNDFDI